MGPLTPCPPARRFPRLERIWADRGYCGQLRNWVAQQLGCRFVVLEASLPSTPPLPHPRLTWVERVLHMQWIWPPCLTVHLKRWLIWCRRHARDYEGLPRTSEAFICLACLRLMLVRLTR